MSRDRGMAAPTDTRRGAGARHGSGPGRGRRRRCEGPGSRRSTRRRRNGRGRAGRRQTRDGRSSDRGGTRYLSDDPGRRSGTADRGRCRSGRDDRRRWRRRWSRGARRQERRRVDVAVRRGRDPDTEVDVRRRPFDVATAAGDSHGIALGDGCALLDADLAEVREGDGVAVELDRHGTTRGRDDTGERDDPRRGRPDGFASIPGDVDTPVLAGRVRVGAERVGAKHVAVQRPRPGRCRRSQDKYCEYGQHHEEPAHDAPPVPRFDNDDRRTVLAPSDVVKNAYRERL